MPASAREQPRSGDALPFASPGNCPSGYYQSADSRSSEPDSRRGDEAAGGELPLRWYASGAACVKL